MAKVLITIADEDKKLIFEAAHIARMTMSAFIRHASVLKAQDVIKDGGVKL